MRYPGCLGLSLRGGASVNYSLTSLDICRWLVNLILNQQHTMEDDTTTEQRRIEMKIKSDKRNKKPMQSGIVTVTSKNEALDPLRQNMDFQNKIPFT